MSFAGGLWNSVNRFASQAKMNLKSVLVGTGDQILSLAPGSLLKGMVASVTQDSTGGSLKTGNIVQWDGNSWHTPEGTEHNHTSVQDGGLFSNIMLEAIQNTWFANFPGVTQSMFYHSGTAGATYTDTINGTNVYVEVATGATLNNAGNLRYGGFLYDFTKASVFLTRIQLADSTTASLARCGMNMEVADALTDNKTKYGFEGCSTCNETNISIISSDGVLRSKNTESTDNYSTTANFIMRCDPGVSVKYRRELGAIITKTTHVPFNGVPDRANAWLCGIQTSTAGTKKLRLSSFYASGSIGGTVPTV